MLTLSNPSNANLGIDSVYTYTIADNDNPIVEFNTISSNGAESVSSAAITVDLSGAFSQTVMVNYTVTGTATGSGTDYTLSDGTLTIDAGEIAGTISITDIVDDLLDEDNESVIITLSSPSNAILGNDIVHTYTINDNDNLPVIDFNVISSSSEEPSSSYKHNG